MKRLIVCFIGFVILASAKGYGQPSGCSENTNPCILIVNGRLHTYPYPATEGHPFFLTKNWIKGEIVSGELTCPEAQLRYDIYLDVMLIQILTEGEPSVISLNPDEYDRVLLSGHQFVPAVKAGVDQKYLPALPKYVEILHSNRLMLLGGYSKHIRKGSPGIPDEFVETDKFWLKKDGDLYLLKNRKNLMQALKDKKKEIRQFMRQNNIVRIDNSEDLSRIIAYYERLNH